MPADTLLDIAMMHSDALITRAREGDKNAQGKLVQLWYKRIYNFSYKFFFDHDLAMEAAQKTFISMHKNLPNLNEATRFRPWLYTIAVNFCREELRKKKTAKSVSLFDLNPGEAEDSYNWERSEERSENPEKMLRQAELSDLLQKCLMELSEEQREVVIMKEYEGLKFREIAEALNISENTVKSRMYYGLDGLKKIFDKNRITKESIGYEN
jgi:RNA polymerase sigma factor (sigma-70 family)